LAEKSLTTGRTSNYQTRPSKPGTKEKIIDMAMNGAGTRDTGRVLRISPNTVTDVLKKRKNLQNQ